MGTHTKVIHASCLSGSPNLLLLRHLEFTSPTKRRIQGHLEFMSPTKCAGYRVCLGVSTYSRTIKNPILPPEDFAMTRPLGFLALLFAASLAFDSHAQSNLPVVDLGYAKYQGFFDATANVTSFFGIRYASPPVGDLRFRAPQPPANVSGVQQAHTQPPQCFQGTTGRSPTHPSMFDQTMKRQDDQTEDCLFLNVHFPGSTIPTKGLPTVVWIHGGGYILGRAQLNAGPDFINEANREIVVVSIQYRLGLFGFLSGTEVKENGTLNAGLLDQQFALRWVHEHISKFGGLSSEVTIWGKSAGAGSVLQHVIAEDGRTTPQLFRAAITSSTFLPSQYSYNDRIPEAIYSEVVTQTNCASSSNTLACLRAASAGTLQAANIQISSSAFFGSFLFVPVVDGTFITQRPTEAFRQFKVNGKAVLTVTNTNEGVSFVDQSTENVNTTFYIEQLFPNLGLQEIQQAVRLYTGLGLTPLQQAELIMGESIFICPSYYLLNAFPLRAFKGEFAVPPATHGTEEPYYFQSARPPPFHDPAFTKAFSQSFMAFILFMDPNSKFDPTNITPGWDSYLPVPLLGNAEMVFNSTEDGSAADIHEMSTDGGRLKRCGFWESVGALTGQ
ncbi:hypothetical protein D9758_003854 [Tetrapyrgos nigripes]|uniref:Carboxylic ester hydrolase n=1 Tax=Tetrapyrgos nigripes TaxID=182062 RepID=A0A8H5LRW3_9AGAR|nr:hypothetical protein D9758_003854 [Tetrapyrgos nigripes]